MAAESDIGVRPELARYRILAISRAANRHGKSREVRAISGTMRARRNDCSMVSHFHGGN